VIGAILVCVLAIPALGMEPGDPPTPVAAAAAPTPAVPSAAQVLVEDTIREAKSATSAAKDLNAAMRDLQKVIAEKAAEQGRR
jgi:hypothetical protein